MTRTFLNDVPIPIGIDYVISIKRSLAKFKLQPMLKLAKCP